MRLPLVGGSYSTRSIIASAQRCINLFPEINQRGALVPVTHYQRPGLVPKIVVGTGPIRQIYRPSNGVGAFVVSGSSVYKVDESWNTTLLGTITPNQINPVSMIDNGIQVILVDNSPNGWTWNLTGAPGFQQIDDPTGTFAGATRVDFMDTFILWNMPGTATFGSTQSNQIQPFNPLYYASKTDYPDLLQTLLVNRHEILLLGQLKSEVWYNTGGALFPFAELPGAFIEHGIAAVYSAASQDISTYWLEQNLQGSGVVMRFRGYQTERISNHAVEFAIRKMRLSSTIADAIGYIYQMDGHINYVLQFPSGNQTWVYDESIGDPTLAWHQEAWTNPADGSLNRHRGNCAAFINGLNVAGDWENGTIYEMDPDSYTDTVKGNKGPVTYIRTFPHIGIGITPSGQPAEHDGRRMLFNAFVADFEPGMSGLAWPSQQITLTWSRDRGRTWGNPVIQDAGAEGDYLAQPVWRNLGEARYMVFELQYSIDGPAALNGAWVDAKVLGS